MNKTRTIALNIIAGFFILLSILIIIVATSFYIPRTPVEIKDFRTIKNSYEIGELITVSLNIKINNDSKSIYDNRLDCKEGRNLLNKLEINSIAEDVARDVITNVGAVPTIPIPDNCVVINNSCHEVNIVIFHTRTYCYSRTSNEFSVFR